MTAPDPAADPVDAVITGLVAAWTGAPELVYDRDGVAVALDVFDGPPLHNLDAWRAVLVGQSAQYLPGGAQANQRHGFGDVRRAQVDVVSELRVWSGDTDVAALRGVALGVLGDLDALVRADHTLGQVADWVRLTRWTYEIEPPEQVGQGFRVTVEFTYRADTTRF